MSSLDWAVKLSSVGYMKKTAAEHPPATSANLGKPSVSSVHCFFSTRRLLVIYYIYFARFKYAILRFGAYRLPLLEIFTILFRLKMCHFQYLSSFFTLRINIWQCCRCILGANSGFVPMSSRVGVSPRGHKYFDGLFCILIRSHADRFH